MTDEGGSMKDIPISTSKESNVKTSDILSFASAVIVVATTAILYFAGWVYIAHWYGFFGLDAAQLNIPIQLVILHGIPGIVTLVLFGLFSATIWGIYSNLYLKMKVTLADLPVILFWAYILSFISLFTIWRTLPSSGGTIPAELYLSIIGILMFFGVYFLVQRSINIFELSDPRNIEPTTLKVRFSAARPNIALRLMVDALQKRKFSRVGDIILRREHVRRMIDRLEKRLRHYALQQRELLIRSIEESWGFWGGAILIFYFLVSISISAVLGDWDAARGGRLMVGNWHIPQVTLFSLTGIPALEKVEQKTATGFEYQPLGLILEDDKVYYLVNWTSNDYYTQKPIVYIIPRSESLSLNFIVSPYVPPTRTPVPTSIPTSTSTPIITLTPTP